MAKKILLGLTTITEGEWRKKVREIDELDLEEVALFPTCLNVEERRELYKLLEGTKLKRIPHVHLRSDMEMFELEYLTRKFKTEVFNIHPKHSHYPFFADYGKYSKNIYIENNGGQAPSDDEIEKYGGLCLDLSHWQSAVLTKGEDCEEIMGLKRLVKKHKIGVNHISAIKPESMVRHDRFLDQDFCGYDSHRLNDLSDLDYVKKCQDYLADIISIELENPLKRQLEAKKYLEKIINL